MGRKVVIVSDDNEFIGQVQSYCADKGATVHVFSLDEWHKQGAKPGFDYVALGENPPLAKGTVPMEGAKILQFPQGTHGHRVQTMNQLESAAIKNAIQNYNGNLTEAAKALGIGRATLYRKVKLFNIDPTQARRNNNRNVKKVA